MVAPLIAAGVSLAAPYIAKGMGSLFGLDDPSDEEKKATALREASLQRLRDAADGKTASPAQLAALASQQRAVHALSSMAQKGTVQQRAGNVRAAMQLTPEVMAQQGAVAAQTRAAEMSNARSQLAGQEASIATSQAASGRADREYQQKLIGAGVQGAAGAFASDALTPEKTKPPAATAPAFGTTAQASTAAPAPAAPVATPAAAAPVEKAPLSFQTSGTAQGRVAPGGAPAAPAMGGGTPYAPTLGKAPLPVAPMTPAQLRLGQQMDAETAAARAPNAPFTLGQVPASKKKEPVAPATNAMTRSTAQQALTAGYTAQYGAAPNQETTNMLLAQWALETNHGKSMPQNNFGGITGTSASGQSVVVQGLSAGEGKVRHRIYDTPEEGATDFVGLLKRKYPAAMAAAAAGDTAGYVAALKNGGYFGGDQAAYAKAIGSLYRHSAPSTVASTGTGRPGGV